MREVYLFKNFQATGFLTFFKFSQLITGTGNYLPRHIR